MFVVSQFGRIGFYGITVRSPFSEGAVSEFHPTLHT